MSDQTLAKLEWSAVLDLIEAYVLSAPAREALRSLRPSRDRRESEERLAETAAMAACMAEGPSPPFSAVEPLAPILARARVAKAVLDPRAVLAVVEVCRTAWAVKNWFEPLSERAAALAERVGRLDPCRELRVHIERVLDERGGVKETASPALASLRHKQASIRRLLLERLEGIIQARRDALQDPIVTLREGRYVIPVRPEQQRQIPGVVHGTSGSGATVFLEPLETVEDNNRLRALVDEEEAEVRRLLREITAEVARNEVALAVTARELASLEVTAAKARFGEAFGGVIPEWSDDGRVELKDARHPLLAAKGSVVPIDVSLGGRGAETVLVVTGPNTGGKTVALKTIGLSACMMKAGVPALAREGSRLPFFEAVVADIGDEQSIEQSLSTFSSHMVQIIDALRQAGPGILVLLDELGAGTDPAEGSALGIAILETLRDVGATVVATTHHEPIKAFAYGAAGVKNASVEFDEATLQPTFRLVMGPAGKSRAFQVAERLGMLPAVLERARALRRPGGVEDLIERLEGESRRLKALEAEMVSYGEELERQIGLQQAAAASLEKEKSSLRELVSESLQAMRRKLEEFVADVRKGRREAAFPQEIFEEAVPLREALEPAAPAGAGGALWPGQRVMVKSIGKEGVLRALGVQGAEVAVGPVTVRLTAEEVAQGTLEPLGSKERGRKAASLAVVGGGSPEGFTTELNLVGWRVEEAMTRVDKWLDEAVLGGFESVRIVHGKGTGALGGAVAELLGGHPHVKSFRTAPLEEGGAGVTVVELLR